MRDRVRKRNGIGRARPVCRPVYVEYAGDVAESVRCWYRGIPDPTQVAETYTGQFLEAFSGTPTLIMAPASESRRVSWGYTRVWRCKAPLFESSGATWHLGQLLWALAVLSAVTRFRATHLFVSSFRYMFLLGLLRTVGVRITVIYRTMPRELTRRGGAVSRLTRTLTLAFLRRCADSVIALEPRVLESVRREVDREAMRLLGFRPTFKPFELSHGRRALRHPVRLLYVGRLTRTKGVYDLVDILIELQRMHALDCECRILGDGPERDSLIRRIASAGLARRIRITGYQGRDDVLKAYQQADLCIVPTRRECGEGFNKVIPEALLCALPVVSSAACPAAGLFADAVVRAEPDDVASYAAAVAAVVRDDGRYQQAVTAARACRSEILGHARSFESALRLAADCGVNDRAGTAPASGEGCARC